ncbi:ABC transporter permease [Nocardia crassostreae]|uniref:ABC transporter permease n=1 Tax=Nocardia crassostreae TaxID=53428 RepID=UPI00082EB478|nr:ABC transporter permease [Nocardia crassostreae]
MYNAIRYELTRLTTVRSTWVLLLSGLLLQGLIAFGFTTKDDMTPREQFVGAFGGLPLVLVTLCFTAIAVNSFGHEYRYRTITTTMLTLRRPGRVLAAKALTSAAVAAFGAVAMVSLTLAMQAVNGGVPSEIWRIAQALGAVTLYTVLAALVGLGIAAVTRNAVLAMVAAIGVPTVVEVGAMLLGVSPKLMPFTSAAMLVRPYTGVAALMSLPLLGLAAGLLCIGGVLLARRDV